MFVAKSAPCMRRAAGSRKKIAQMRRNGALQSTMSHRAVMISVLDHSLLE